MAYKRKYHKGEKITSLDELVKQEFVYFYDKITHIGWFCSWQLQLAHKYIIRGCLYYAESIGENSVQRCKVEIENRKEVRECKCGARFSAFVADKTDVMCAKCKHERGETANEN